MDKEITIILTDREIYYLAQADAWKKGQRRRFGVTKLSEKVYEQLSKEISAQRMATLNEEWSEAKDRADANSAVTASNGYCTKHRIFGKCALCETKLVSKKVLKKIETPEMSKNRADERADRYRERLLKKAEKLAHEGNTV